ncbi:tyrosine-protein phosphatase [Candidatus Pacearchaeota archaeon]|nr:tyrosine-protein phosphatase [Candidatus Pacearchaeota archaeon]
MPAKFSQVTNNLYRGGCPSAMDLVKLKSMGIKKIVSLDDECGNSIVPVCEELGLKHIIWGIGDGKDPKVAALKKRIIPTLTHGGPTYIHCFHGKDRTGMAVAMYRIYTGWPIGKALDEAAKFGMGTHLQPIVTRSYYDAVKEFYDELEIDKGNAIDAVSLTRQNNSFAPQNPAVDDMTITRPVNFNLPPGTDIEFSQLSRIAKLESLNKKAYIRIYIKCKSSDLLKPSTYWYGSKEAANKTPNSSGKMYSANLASSAVFERFDKKVNKSLIQNILTRDIDVAILRSDQYLVIDPEALVDIQEEEDVNNLVDVGLRDNSTDYTFTYPGSGSGVGGMPDGAAGIVQLPYTGPGQV